MTNYEIGAKVWVRGDEITITTEAYDLYGATWQDGVDENGKTVTVPTPAARDANVESKKAAERDMQDGFRRLRERS